LDKALGDPCEALATAAGHEMVGSWKLAADFAGICPADFVGVAIFWRKMMQFSSTFLGVWVDGLMFQWPLKDQEPRQTR
jgi:hypothetical protein